MVGSPEVLKPVIPKEGLYIENSLDLGAYRSDSEDSSPGAWEPLEKIEKPALVYFILP